MEEVINQAYAELKAAGEVPQPEPRLMEALKKAAQLLKQPRMARVVHTIEKLELPPAHDAAHAKAVATQAAAYAILARASESRIHDALLAGLLHDVGRASIATLKKAAAALLPATKEWLEAIKAKPWGAALRRRAYAFEELKHPELGGVVAGLILLRCLADEPGYVFAKPLGVFRLARIVGAIATAHGVTAALEAGKRPRWPTRLAWGVSATARWLFDADHYWFVHPDAHVRAIAWLSEGKTPAELLRRWRGVERINFVTREGKRYGDVAKAAGAKLVARVAELAQERGIVKP